MVRPIVKAGLAFALALCSWWGAAAWAATTVYISPTGSDKNDGSSLANAVATVQRAMDLVVNLPATTGTISIVIAKGFYLEQHFETAGNVNGVPITLGANSGDAVVFNGNEKGGTWMTLKPLGKGGVPSNVTLENFEVTNYETAIDATADRNDRKAWVGGMTIHEMTFSYIGDTANLNATEASTAAIRFVNAQGNKIIRSNFTHIRNRLDCDVLHAVYLAHYSSGNLIDNTYFNDTCGDAVRFRDESGSNTVSNSTFKDAWLQSPTSDWFCDKTKRDDCTKASGECPSIGNKLVSVTEKTAGTNPLPPLFIGYGTPPPNCPSGPRITITP